VIEIGRSLRFAAVEWGAGPGEALEPGHDAGALRELCAAAGLAVSGLSVQDRDVTAATPRRARPYIRQAVALGAQFVRLFAPPYRGGSFTREQSRARAGLDALVELAAPDGVKVLVETSPATLAPTPELAVGLVEHQAPELAGVLFDPGNTVIEGYLAPALAVATLGPYLHHVHVKNIAWRRAAGAWVWRYASLSQGMVVWPEIVCALAAAGFRGGFSIDHLSGKPTAARLALETERLRTLLGEPQCSTAGDTNQIRERSRPSPTNV
jgi:sugar phosphate isomerase/epimerase